MVATASHESTGRFPRMARTIGKLDKEAIERKYEQRHYITLQLLSMSTRGCTANLR
jgi:hypothetical protein